jgi:hypothetical protein
MDRFSSVHRRGAIEADLVPIDAMIHPDAALAMAFWRRRSADGIKIGRDIPSRAVARLLSRAVVCAPLDDGEDFRIHLAGEAIHQYFGYDVTGRSITSVFEDPAEMKTRLDSMHAAVASGEPRMMRIIYRSGRVELRRHEAIALPVTAPNGKDRWVLVFAFYL